MNRSPANERARRTCLNARATVVANVPLAVEHSATVSSRVVRRTEADVISIGDIDARAVEPARVRLARRRRVTEPLTGFTAHTLNHTRDGV